MAEPATSTGVPSPRLVPPAKAAIELCGHSPSAARLLELVRRAAHAQANVLLVSEPGADVELVAREIHKRGRAAAAAWVLVDCADPLAEQALFGASGAVQPSDLEAIVDGSSVAAARGGTLFLRDVGELSASAQSRLARIARDREVRIDGAAVATDMRIVVAASTAVDADVRDNRLRADLYRRVAGLRIDVPPLRERAEDVPEMAARLLSDLTDDQSPPRTFTQAALALLGALAWPGNTAELRAVVERAAIACGSGAAIQIEHILPALSLERARPAFTPAGNLREARLRFERDYIAAVLQHHGWRMAEAAQTLGIQRPNLYRKARQLGIPVARLAE